MQGQIWKLPISNLLTSRYACSVLVLKGGAMPKPSITEIEIFKKLLADISPQDKAKLYLFAQQLIQGQSKTAQPASKERGGLGQVARIMPVDHFVRWNPYP